MARKCALTKEREKQGLTLQALSQKADVAYKTIWNLEHRQEKRISYYLKEKVAKALKKEVWEIFPDVKKLIKKLFDSLSHGEKIMLLIKSNFPDLKLKKGEEEAWIKALEKMNEEAETLGPFQLGRSLEFCKKIMQEYIKKFKIDEQPK